jgi:hypothetical protein
MATSDLSDVVEAQERTNALLERIAQALEAREDAAVGGAATAPTGGASQGGQGGAASTGEQERKDREKRGEALKRAALSVGLDAVEAMTDPFQSNVLAGVDASLRLGQLGAAAIGNAVAGDVGAEIGAAGVRAGVNASGLGAQIGALRQAQGDLYSRVAGATDAGVIFSDQQLEELAGAEISRQQARSEQLQRARKGFDAAAASAGLGALGGDVDAQLSQERNSILSEIRDTLREQNPAPSLRSEG